MKIESLFDLKEVLNKIPDDDLNNLGFGFWEGNEELSLLNFDDEIEAMKFYDKCDKKYPGFKDVRDWFRVLFDISEIYGHDNASDKLDQVYDLDCPISSEFKFD